MRQIMSGQISPVMMRPASWAAREEGNIGEITAAAQVMRELATRVTVKDPDNGEHRGTGGTPHTQYLDRSMFVAAARGGRVAKHGTALSRSRAARTCWRRWRKHQLKPGTSGSLHRRDRGGLMFGPAHTLRWKHAAA